MGISVLLATGGAALALVDLGFGLQWALLWAAAAAMWAASCAPPPGVMRVVPLAPYQPLQLHEMESPPRFLPGYPFVLLLVLPAIFPLLPIPFGFAPPTGALIPGVLIVAGFMAWVTYTGWWRAGRVASLLRRPTIEGRVADGSWVLHRGWCTHEGVGQSTALVATTTGTAEVVTTHDSRWTYAVRHLNLAPLTLGDAVVVEPDEQVEFGGVVHNLLERPVIDGEARRMARNAWHWDRVRVEPGDHIVALGTLDGNVLRGSVEQPLVVMADATDPRVPLRRYLRARRGGLAVATACLIGVLLTMVLL